MRKPRKNDNIKRDSNGEIIINKQDLCYHSQIESEKEEAAEPLFTLSYDEVIPDGKILKSFEF